IINEAGLYHALFTMEPKNARGISDEAINERIEKLRSFKRWITHEVIPTIRKTGAYMTPETAMKIVSNPDFLIATANKIKQLQGDVAERDERITELEDQLTAAVEDNDKLSKRVMENGIKAWFADRVIDSGENMCIRETAKELGVKESDFTSMLVERKYLYRNKSHQGRLLPYSSPQCRGVFVVKEVQFKGGMTYQSQTLITPAGRIKLHAECIKAGLINEMPVQDSILWEV
ncbi:MAG: phage antirepressor KilAC domain-containing protein, partial [Ruminococcus sp.]|nr:phage antirepressor KilAC domain-containing protein [Ruminococcus sp.]